MKVESSEQIILIVDDKPANLDVIRAFLKEHNFKILVANSGDGALSRVAHIRPDLILLDVLMPGIDGFETCRRLKEMEGIKDIPVIFMSALTDSEHKTEGFRVGAVDFITKPVRKEELLARVNTHLEIMRYRLYLEEEVARRTAELERSEEEYRLLFNNANDAIFIFKGGLCVKCNIKALELLGADKERIIGAPPFSRFIPEKQPNGRESAGIVEDIVAGRSKSLELTLLHQGRTPFLAELNINRFEMIGDDCLQVIVNDISQKRKLKEMEKALVQSSKMAEIGALTAGIVHEIKNPLAGIEQTNQNIGSRLLDSEMAKNRAVADEVGLSFGVLQDYLVKRSIAEMLEDIRTACGRMREVISNMLTFSHKTRPVYERVDLKKLFHETLLLAKFSPDFAAIKEIVVEDDEELPPISCIKSKIEQVILNILNNGAQAMMEYKRGNAAFIPSFQMKLSAGERAVQLTFQDNGPGIDRETISKVFDLFFTTKSVERGTGLGLYICKQIIEEDHKGKLEIESSPGCGARVMITLPIEQPGVVGEG